MKVVAAIDSFKGSLSSMEAGHAAKEGVLLARPEADMIVKPLADGGEGTTDALIEGMNGQKVEMTATGPLGKPVDCYYGYLPDSRTAIIEMAAAAGITLVTEAEKNPLAATTYGVGEMILNAMEKGCRNFIIGIGGSATNDGGIGMLRALGFTFADQGGGRSRRGRPGAGKDRFRKNGWKTSASHRLPFPYRLRCEQPLMRRERRHLHLRSPEGRHGGHEAGPGRGDGQLCRCCVP